jgi:nicotinamide phosphoribosyltransferase
VRRRIYPTGFVSIVSDTWDFFGALENIYKPLKEQILARDGKVVIRPDSGDPVKIVCGDSDAPKGSLEYKGAFEVLWDIFGGTTNDKGYKLLDDHIGLIYGDAITPERQEAMLSGLEKKGFAPTVVLGIGSYTYNANTRDSLGMAVKASSVVINGVRQAIFKDPKTDDGVKKSLYGRAIVVSDGDSIKVIDETNIEEYKANIENDLMRTVFKNGELLIDDSIFDIRNRTE